MHSSTLQNPDQNKVGSHWQKDGHDYICNLGTVKKAIVIRLFYNKLNSAEQWYGIALASFLPFTEQQHEKRFDIDKPHEAINFAEGIVREWVQSLFVAEQHKEIV